MLLSPSGRVRLRGAAFADGADGPAPVQRLRHGRLEHRDGPDAGKDLSYTYDTLGRLTSVAWTGQTGSFTWDALSRNTGQTTALGTTGFDYDLASRRTRITWPDNGLFVQYDYDLADEMTYARENNAQSGQGVLAKFSYDDLGRRTLLERGDGWTRATGGTAPRG